jgi:hypothetical protein
MPRKGTEIQLQSLQASARVAEVIMHELIESKRLAESIRAQEAAQQIFHRDVEMLLSVVDRFGSEMPNEIKRSYFSAILQKIMKNT